MTTAIFLSLFFAFFVAVLNWLPDADATNSIFLTSFDFIVGAMKSWNWLFPINELFVAVGIVIAYEVIVWSWFHVLVPVMRIVRGSTH